MLRKLAVIFSAFAFILFRFRNYIADDAYISLRYARNFADGIGFVFNEGQKVEGYTNFLWTALMSLPFHLNISPEFFASAFGILCSIGTLFYVAKGAGYLQKRAWIFLFAPLWLALEPSFGLWTTAGLETPLFTFLITAALFKVFIFSETPKLTPLIGILFALASLTRPEGVLFALTTLGVIIYLHRRLTPSTLTSVFLFSVIFFPYFFWRSNYYGSLLPNTFYAKVDLAGSQTWRGLSYLNQFLFTHAYLPLLVCGVFFFIQPFKCIFLLVPTCIYLLYVVYVGGDGLLFFRFIVPILPIISIFMALTIEHVFKTHKRIAILLICASFSFNISGAFVGKKYRKYVADAAEVQTWKTIGTWFNEHAQNNESLMVLPAGAMPYFSKLISYDMLGLTDPFIAHKKMTRMGSGQAGHEKYDTGRILELNPDYVVVGSYWLASSQKDAFERQVFPYYPVEKELLASMEFRKQYNPKLAQVGNQYFIYFAKNKGRSNL